MLRGANGVPPSHWRDKDTKKSDTAQTFSSFFVVLLTGCRIATLRVPPNQLMV